VGLKASRARFNLAAPQEVRELLNKLVEKG
jgi:hypothetical protein